MKLFMSPSPAFKFFAVVAIAPAKYPCVDLKQDECKFSTINEAEIFLNTFKLAADEYINSRWWGPLSDGDTLTYQFKITDLKTNAEQTFSSLAECESWIAVSKEIQKNKFMAIAKQLFEIRRRIAEKESGGISNIDLSAENEEKILSTMDCTDQKSFDRWSIDNALIGVDSAVVDDDADNDVDDKISAKCRA